MSERADVLVARNLGEFINIAMGLSERPGVFRGLAHEEYGLETTLDRFERENGEAEERLLRDFKQRSPPYFRQMPRNDWEYLIHAQHYGLPTRLLDWTFSPLVAAHFATREHPGKNAVVWHLDWHKIHERRFHGRVLTLDELAGWWKGPTDRLGAPQDFIALVAPPAVDDRMIAQQSCFSISSEKGEAFNHLLSSDHFIGVLTKIVIPGGRASPKEAIRRDLDAMQVNERMLLPGLDGITAALKREHAGETWRVPVDGDPAGASPKLS